MQIIKLVWCRNIRCYLTQWICIEHTTIGVRYYSKENLYKIVLAQGRYLWKQICHAIRTACKAPRLLRRFANVLIQINAILISQVFFWSQVRELVVHVHRFCVYIFLRVYHACKKVHFVMLDNQFTPITLSSLFVLRATFAYIVALRVLYITFYCVYRMLNARS